MSDNSTILANVLAMIAGGAQKQPEITENTRGGLLGLVAPKKKEGSFWDKPGGSVLASLLGTLATGGVGAGLGALVSPGARGLGAARGAGMGAGMGLMEDIGMRKAAAGGPLQSEKSNIEKTKLLAQMGKWEQDADYKKKILELYGAKFGLEKEKYGDLSILGKVQRYIDVKSKLEDYKKFATAKDPKAKDYELTDEEEKVLMNRPSDDEMKKYLGSKRFEKTLFPYSATGESFNLFPGEGE